MDMKNKKARQVIQQGTKTPSVWVNNGRCVELAYLFENSGVWYPHSWVVYGVVSLTGEQTGKVK